ncbi:MAG TPA: hypothetical protein VG010_10065 [Solirubrobacteraceae bacterium]|nr:hypothetical protein [Solirubrobacteraceae bacterium]
MPRTPRPLALYGLLREYLAMPSTEITVPFAQVAAQAASPLTGWRAQLEPWRDRRS